MAKAELGTKRVCPETERKFYDLNRDPIVSPYTGMSYPLSFFEAPVEEPVVEVKKEEEAETTETTAEADVPELDADGVEIVSLEDADDETLQDAVPKKKRFKFNREAEEFMPVEVNQFVLGDAGLE